MKRRAQAGEAVVRLLFAEHGHALLRYATHLTGDPLAAQDVVQETLVRAWRHLEAVTDHPGPVRPWLFTVARNIVIDRARARSTRPAEVPLDVAPEDHHESEDHAGAVVDAITLRDALATLSEAHREVVVQLYFHCRTVAEAACLLGIAPGTVKSRSYHALRALRARLTDGPALPVASVCGA